MSCSKSKKIYGHLAVLKLVSIANYDAGLGDAAKRVLGIIVGFSGVDGTCYPSVSKIAKNCGISRPAVTKQIKILEDHKYLKRHTRYYSETGGCRTNIIEFNIEMAQQYASNPSVFCRANIDYIVATLVTLLSYGGLSLLEVIFPETLRGCTKRTHGKKHIKENKKKTIKQQLINRKKVHANAWEIEKKEEDKTGVTASDKKILNEAVNELRFHCNPRRMTALSIEICKEIRARNMLPKEAIAHQVKRYQERLKDITEQQG